MDGKFHKLSVILKELVLANLKYQLIFEIRRKMSQRNKIPLSRSNILLNELEYFSIIIL